MCVKGGVIPSWFTDIYTAVPWYTVCFKNIHSGVTMSFQVHCEPKHLSLREIKLARYLISAYSGTSTVELHSAAHADPAYRRSNAGQRLPAYSCL